MTGLKNALDDVLASQKKSQKPLAVLIAGHNGSGKSTMWSVGLAEKFQIPLVNADRMMMWSLPLAVAHGVPFAIETSFSRRKKLLNGKVVPQIGMIATLQAAGYFVLLFFVGLASHQLSIARVATRAAQGGHDIDVDRLKRRFPRTQKAIRMARTVADATILVDNSRQQKQAFTVCRVQMKDREIYDIRNTPGPKPAEILAWLSVVAPR